MRALTSLFLVLGLIGCAGTSSEPADPTTTSQPADPTTTTEGEPEPESEPEASAAGLRWTITAHPAHLTMAQRATFRLRRTATNEGSGPLDAMHSSAQFTLNGEASMALDLAFGNGARESLWSALPPGRTVFDEREMGDSLFPAPGTYVITMTVDGQTSSVEVVVRP